MFVKTHPRLFFCFLSYSLWGKFGERQNKPETHSINTPAQLFTLLDDHTYRMSNVRICSEDVLEVVTTRDEDAYQPSFKINVFIAAFTTAQARLRLYDTLEKLDKRVLYMDTDSIIYHSREGQEMIPTGRFLGQFTNETPGDSIVEFVTGGPKNYGYCTKKGKTECKVRGFSLNYETMQRLNYTTMKENLLLELEEPLDYPRTMAIPIPDYFARDQEHKKIKLTDRVKQYKLVFDKRVLDPATKTSTPFGFVWMREGV